MSVCDLGVIASSSSLLRFFVRKRKMLRFLFADIFSCLYKLALPIRSQSVIHRRVQKILYKLYSVLTSESLINYLTACLSVNRYSFMSMCLSVSRPVCLVIVSVYLRVCLSNNLCASISAWPALVCVFVSTSVYLHPQNN